MVRPLPANSHTECRLQAIANAEQCLQEESNTEPRLSANSDVEKRLLTNADTGSSLARPPCSLYRPCSQGCGSQGCGSGYFVNRFHTYRFRFHRFGFRFQQAWTLTKSGLYLICELADKHDDQNQQLTIYKGTLLVKMIA